MTRAKNPDPNHAVPPPEARNPKAGVCALIANIKGTALSIFLVTDGG